MSFETKVYEGADDTDVSDKREKPTDDGEGICSDAGKQAMDAFGVEDVECYNCYNYSEGDLIEKLKKAFGISDDENPTIEELLDIAAGHPGINIDMWEYESLFGTF